MNEDKSKLWKIIGIVILVTMVILIITFKSKSSETLEQCITRKADEYNFTLKEPTTFISINKLTQVNYIIIEIGEPMPLLYHAKDGCYMIGWIDNRTEFDRNYIGFNETRINVKNQKVRR